MLDHRRWLPLDVLGEPHHSVEFLMGRTAAGGQVQDIVITGWLATHLRCAKRMFFTWQGAAPYPRAVEPLKWRPKVEG